MTVPTTALADATSEAGTPDLGGATAAAVPTAAGPADPLATIALADGTGTVQVDPDRRGPGRPRSTRVDEAIISAVTDLLLEGTTAEALSIEAVAARAGVGKATIYRRWANKEALLVDAVASLKGPPPDIAGESVRDDLVVLLEPVGRQTSTRAATVLPCLVSELRRSPMLNQVYQRIMEPRRELMREVLRRGIAAGELRADLDLEAVMAMLTAPMLATSMLDWNPNLPRTGLPRRLVDSLWPAIAA